MSEQRTDEGKTIEADTCATPEAMAERALVVEDVVDAPADRDVVGGNTCSYDCQGTYVSVGGFAVYL